MEVEVSVKLHPKATGLEGYCHGLQYRMKSQKNVQALLNIFNNDSTMIVSGRRASAKKLTDESVRPAFSFQINLIVFTRHQRKFENAAY